MESKPEEKEDAQGQGEGKVDAKTQVVYDLAAKNEIELNEEESKMDYSKMHRLDLGPQENYKTKMV